MRYSDGRVGGGDTPRLCDHIILLRSWLSVRLADGSRQSSLLGPAGLFTFFSSPKRISSHYVDLIPNAIFSACGTIVSLEMTTYGVSYL